MPERRSDDHCEEKMGSQREDRFHSSPRGIVHQGCRHDRRGTRFAESITEGCRLGDANAYVFHKPGGTRAECEAAGKTRKGKVLTYQKDRAAKEIAGP